MISLDKCNETCNFAAELSSKVFFLSKTKDVNIKVPNIITNRNGAKILIKHISYDGGDTLRGGDTFSVNGNFHAPKK